MRGKPPGRHAACRHAAVDVAGEVEVVSGATDLARGLKLPLAGSASAAAKSATPSDQFRSTWFCASEPLAESDNDWPVNCRSDNVRSLPRSVAARCSLPLSPTRPRACCIPPVTPTVPSAARVVVSPCIVACSASVMPPATSTLSIAAKGERSGAVNVASTLRFAPVSALASSVNSLCRTVTWTGRSG